MCGIYFSIGYTPDPSRIDRVKHRGPDSFGWQVFATRLGPVSLGHRRLSIIDLNDRASQPFKAVDDDVWTVFNGEIYNYLELRELLIRSGCAFVTESDTEVLVAAYRKWGARCVDHFVGMYAFVIWDRCNERMFAARDRFGIKPLYFTNGASGLAFGSEIKQLIGLQGPNNRLNYARTYDYLSAGLTDHSHETMFEGICQIGAGEYLDLDLGTWQPGVSIVPTRYYRMPHGVSHGLNRKEAAAKFHDLMQDSVRIHLRADVPVGACLSGGLDSSTLVCLMTNELKASNRPVHTFGACFEEKEADERPFMDEVISHTGAEFCYVYLSPSDFSASAAKVTYHQDEPFGSTSMLAQWHVFAAAQAADIKVMLDGQGADEQLAGYHAGFVQYVNHLVSMGRWIEIARVFIQRKLWHGVTLKTQFNTHFMHRIPRSIRPIFEAFRANPVLDSEDRWLNSDAMLPHRMASNIASEAIKREAPDDLDRLCQSLMETDSLGHLLRYEDRNAMAHSIEARVPFLDHRLVEFCLGLGNDFKMSGGNTKNVLRDAMRGILPETIRRRRDKRGFTTPEQRWFRTSLRPFIENGIEATLQRFPGLLVEHELRSLAAQMLDGKRPLDWRVWRIVNLGIWGNIYDIRQ
ncbi:MAG: asparagine synthase (glutamine-hydrolyzing) [Alphaproteobacteria bacterium]|nr:asparagine synthase (glutamine-hydrolyzing) [Alphaproteobacteria bacterium]MDE2493951.1 asparagine synthase (glutamine-hydrolyzing) [Alphaproteobacteria bacterium]